MTNRSILLVHDAVAADRDVISQWITRGYEVTGIPLAASVEFAVPAGATVVVVDAPSIAVASRREMSNVFRLRWALPVLFVTEPDEALPTVPELAAGAFGYVVRGCSDRERYLSIELEIARSAGATAVSEQENRFFAVSIDMLCFLNFSGHFAWLNAAWERTLGFTRAELMSRPFIQFVHPDDRERTLAQNARVRAGGQARAFENRYLCKDGSYRWLHWNAAPHVESQVIYSVARDVTERKQAEAEREQLLAELQKALAEVNSLRAILPLCSYCRRVRDDENYWHTVEQYINTNTTTRFSHGICPSCLESEVLPTLESLEHRKMSSG